jgi:tRNA(fMet)-specific endonuclease VapC
VTRLKLLLDTDTCIHIARERPASALIRFRRHAAGEGGMSVVTYGELLFGAAKSSNPGKVYEVLEQLTNYLPVLPIDRAVSERYGTLRATLEQQGKPIGGNDLWIASHALALGVVLVTNNEREFARVSGLKLQNWVK